MNSSHKLILFLIAFAIVAVGILGFFNPMLALGIGIFILCLTFILRKALLPPAWGVNAVRAKSLGIAAILAAGNGYWAEPLSTWVKAFTKDSEIGVWFPWLISIELNKGPSIVVYIFITVVIWIVNHYMADRSIAGNHPDPIAKDFPEKEFSEKLKAFCSALDQHLTKTDREANWSPHYYAALEAEVEVLTEAGARERRKIVDLQQALRSHRNTRSFLILGDPGAGKSVALRKLAIDMLKEVGTTGRIPIYVNLREWLPSDEGSKVIWTEDRPPTMANLVEFIVENIKARGDVFTEEFVNDYFKKLWDHGRLFFLLDSFDEIPQLLDADEDSWLLDTLSGLLHRFISTNPASRGALASRVFRRPSHAFISQKTLEIRPLSEHRIALGLMRFKKLNPVLKNELFRERADLMPVARNPFLMTLLGEWVNEHGVLPDVQAQLYESYLIGRLSKCKDKIRKAGLTQQEVLDGATAIADFVFQSPEYGLEAPVHVIGEKVGIANVNEIVNILGFARLARVTQGENPSFAFVHRRFLEYLVTMVMLNNPNRLPEDHIPTDSRGRDVMVLYAQICEPMEAKRLAHICWLEVQKYQESNEQRLRAIHCLRFLLEAYRSRQAAVEDFVDELQALIADNIKADKNLLQAKIFLEATGILPASKAIPLLQAALDSGNVWLQETAFRACRHLPQLTHDLEKSIKRYVVNITPLQFLTRYEALHFSLSLSDALKPTLLVAQFLRINIFISIVGALFLILLMPLIPVIILISSISSLAFVVNIPMYFLLKTIKFFIFILLFFQLFYLNLSTYLIGNFYMSTYNYPSIFDILNGNNLHEGMLWPQYILFILLINWTSIYIKDFDAVKLMLSTFKMPSFLEGLKGLFKFILFSISITVIAALAFGVVSLIILLLTIIPQLFKDIIAYVIAIPLLIIAITLFSGYILKYIGDYHYFTKVQIGQTMSRSEIAAIFLRINNSRWQLKFVNRLTQQRVIATGEWPINFKLTVSSNLAITELARLEERWLKLDR